jgi:ribosomal protein S25
MKYNIRVSMARKLLREFEREGLVVYVDGNSRLRIYKGAKAKIGGEG